MGMPGRQYSAGDAYRYGFNGKENDSEVKGEGNQQDYGMRIYDPRVGKFLSVDPISSEYPELTPYQFASNMPLNSVDLDGLEAKEAYIWVDNTGRKTKLELTVANPYGLGKGTFYHYYQTEEIFSCQESNSSVEVQLKNIEIHFYVPPARTILEQLGDWFKSKFPQVQVWGSGTEQFGSNADPNRPVYSVNLKDDDWSVLLALPNLMGTPDLNGAGWNKVPKLMKKIYDIIAKKKIDEMKSPSSSNAQTTSSEKTSNSTSSQNNKSSKIDTIKDLKPQKPKTIVIPSKTTPEGRRLGVGEEWGHYYHGGTRGKTNDTIWKNNDTTARKPAEKKGF